MTQDPKTSATKYRGYAAAFQDKGVVEAYHLRAPYPPETFDVLSGLIEDAPGIARRVLDAGCGTGNIARTLVQRGEYVDAVDFSLSMIEQGKLLPSGTDPRLHWIHGRLEEVELAPFYSLITAAESLHWMDWSIVMPRFRALLVEGGYLAMVATQTTPDPWSPLGELLPRYRTDHYQAQLQSTEEQALFQKVGEHVTEPISFVQSIDDYVESFHSRAGFSRERMGRERAEAFDREARELLSQVYREGVIPFQVRASVVWGIPG